MSANGQTKALANQYTEKIGVGEKIAYDGGDLASNLILVLTSTFVTFFYTDALGLNPAIIGTIMMLSRVFDGFTDIFMGFVMDQVKSKHGKARCWLLWLAIPIALAMVLVFLVPNIGETGKYIYVAITYNLVTTFLYTMINIPYGALTSLMTRDQDQRTVINIFRMFMAQVGSLIINAFTLPFINAVGGSTQQRSWIIVSVIYGVVAAVGSGALFALLTLMGGFMTYNYLTDNLGDISKLWMILPALVMAAVGIWIAWCVPMESRSKALRYAAVALLYFILVIIIMNSLKTVWGRMRFREMTDPVNQFTRWYQIVPRGGFNNIYASFPSGHSMNSAGVILLMLLPPMIPALRGREKALHAFVYIWCVLVGISRVFMGAHFSSDVTVGVLLSLAIFEALRAILYRNVPQNVLTKT